MEIQSSQKDKGSPKKILLIEDDKLCQWATTELLNEMNYHVDIANNAHEALQLLKNAYDMILLDIGLPDIDGMTLAETIRDRLKINIPIVATTAHSWDKKRYEEIKITDQLRKPITKQGLTHILKKYI